jgi:hypothetical protein
MTVDLFIIKNDERGYFYYQNGLDILYTKDRSDAHVFTNREEVDEFLSRFNYTKFDVIPF